MDAVVQGCTRILSEYTEGLEATVELRYLQKVALYKDTDPTKEKRLRPISVNTQMLSVESFLTSPFFSSSISCVIVVLVLGFQLS